ncbi:hypothetical protein PV08_05578 [Exophiala spinifera]|uniref:Uncharacterized protein n=1 Tax=Exophiala spinifera TaxID=91928 RepID=A0A0D1YKN3_9EURO|nr:uncharacterized protein PV08_05578 [Exophiala spinifera]KIW15531.1 hypothetical protein PV08_05578 [Exophiala spinifera]
MTSVIETGYCACIPRWDIENVPSKNLRKQSWLTFDFTPGSTATRARGSPPPSPPRRSPPASASPPPKKKRKRVAR